MGIDETRRHDVSRGVDGLLAGDLLFRDFRDPTKNIDLIMKDGKVYKNTLK